MKKQLVIEHFKKLSDKYTLLGEIYKANTFTRVANALFELEQDEINSSKELPKLPGIGPSSIKELDEILLNGETTSRLKLLENRLFEKTNNDESAKKTLNAVMNKFKMKKHGSN